MKGWLNAPPILLSSAPPGSLCILNVGEAFRDARLHKTLQGSIRNEYVGSFPLGDEEVAMIVAHPIIDAEHYRMGAARCLFLCSGGATGYGHLSLPLLAVEP